MTSESAANLASAVVQTTDDTSRQKDLLVQTLDAAQIVQLLKAAMTQGGASREIRPRYR